MLDLDVLVSAMRERKLNESKKLVSKIENKISAFYKYTDELSEELEDDLIGDIGLDINCFKSYPIDDSISVSLLRPFNILLESTHISKDIPSLKIFNNNIFDFIFCRGIHYIAAINDNINIVSDLKRIIKPKCNVIVTFEEVDKRDLKNWIEVFKQKGFEIRFHDKYKEICYIAAYKTTKDLF